MSFFKPMEEQDLDYDGFYDGQNKVVPDGYESIVLIDFINHRIRAGMPLFDSLREAGRLRFRPVFLTSVTTIGGLFPLMTETSFQAQFLVPMATSLVFGLAATTLIVLVLVPVMYSFFGTSARSVIIDDESDWQEVGADSANHAMV